MKRAVALLAASFLFAVAMQAQQKTSMNVEDLDSDVHKYIDKNFKDFKTTEAFKYAAIYEVKIKKEGTAETLVFDKEGTFLYKKTEADKAKVSYQTRSTISLDDVKDDIAKYVKKNYEGYKLTEAYKYDEVYTAKIVKGAESQGLVFDKEGHFVMKIEKPAAVAAPPAPPAAAPAVMPATVAPPPAAAPVQKTDTLPK